jgi:hypothetical protein
VNDDNLPGKSLQSLRLGQNGVPWIGGHVCSGIRINIHPIDNVLRMVRLEAKEFCAHHFDRKELGVLTLPQSKFDIRVREFDRPDFSVTDFGKVTENSPLSCTSNSSIDAATCSDSEFGCYSPFVNTISATPQRPVDLPRSLKEKGGISRCLLLFLVVQFAYAKWKSSTLRLALVTPDSVSVEPSW